MIYYKTIYQVIPNIHNYSSSFYWAPSPYFLEHPPANFLWSTISIYLNLNYFSSSGLFNYLILWLMETYATPALKLETWKFSMHHPLHHCLSPSHQKFILIFIQMTHNFSPLVLTYFLSSNSMYLIAFHHFKLHILLALLTHTLQVEFIVLFFQNCVSPRTPICITIQAKNLGSFYLPSSSVYSPVQ